MIGNPKYKLGDIVTFRVDNEMYEGKIMIVDAYGTFEQNEEVSYDILVEKCSKYSKGIFFKHVTENLILH